MSRLGHLGARLYRGEVSYDFVARRKLWYTLSAILLLVSVVSLIVRGLTLGIEFRGGAEFQVNSPTVTTSSMRNAVSSVVGGEVVVQKLGSSTVRAQTEKLTENELNRVQTTLAKTFHVSTNDIDTQFIGPSWGKDVSNKALRALIFFLLGVIVFLSLYFEWKMAVAAMIALVHDLVITAGIYSLVGFEVTPATVIGFLTILGYSLYDTVVVFDKVRENTRSLAGGSRMTYSQAANLAVNQTLVRSINTSIIALLPIAAILFAGIVLLGAGPLKDLALALFVGVAIGAYSSIFIATPILASLKEREPAMQALARRVAARASGGGDKGARRGSAAARAAAESDDGEQLDDGLGEPEPAGARAGGPTDAARRPAQPRRPATGAQRSQPRRGAGGGKSRPGGKKKR
ncbi:MAG: preprotein translocase subunit SecF [Actinomycetota bacterium]|jgi:preprotein translocase subunit SecF|nr:preprotein translocase subunit SecF [Actinomycetota bacterium]